MSAGDIVVSLIFSVFPSCPLNPYIMQRKAKNVCVQVTNRDSYNEKPSNKIEKKTRLPTHLSFLSHSKARKNRKVQYKDLKNGCVGLRMGKREEKGEGGVEGREKKVRVKVRKKREGKFRKKKL